MNEARGMRAFSVIFFASDGRIKRAGSLYSCTYSNPKKSKADFSSKSKIFNVHDFLVAKCTVRQLMHACWIVHQLMSTHEYRTSNSSSTNIRD